MKQAPPKSAIMKAQSLKALDELYRKYAYQIVNPADVSDPCILPDPGAQQVCSRKYTRIVEVDSATYPVLRAVMSPDLFTPGFIAGNNAVPIPVSGSGPVSVKGAMATTGVEGVGFNDNVVETSRFVISSGDSSDKGVLMLQPYNNPGFLKTLPAFQVNNTGSLTFSITNASNTDNATPHLNLFAITGGSDWTLLNDVNGQPCSFDISQGQQVYAKINTVFNYLGFEWSNQNGKKLTFDTRMGFDDAQVFPFNATSFAPAFSQQIVDDKITSGRVTAMSILATNTSSALNNGGVIAIGRVPYDFDFSTQFSIGMSKLPTNRYIVGPAAKGGYTWWLPNNEEEWEVGEVYYKAEEYFNSNILACEIHGWPAGASFRLTFTWVVEFYTSNQNFPSEPNPPAISSYAALKSALALVPAATHNPSHGNVAKEIAETIGHYARTLAGYVRDYGPYAMYALEALSMLA